MALKWIFLKVCIRTRHRNILKQGAEKPRKEKKNSLRKVFFLPRALSIQEVGHYGCRQLPVFCSSEQCFSISFCPNHCQQFSQAR